jgi:hypothetical protein
MKVVSLSALRTGRLYLWKYSWYLFLLELSRPQGHGTARRVMSMKISNDTIGNRPCALPVCSAVPQPLRYRVPHCMKVWTDLMWFKIRTNKGLIRTH